MKPTSILVLVIAIAAALALVGAGWKWGSSVPKQKAASVIPIAYQDGWTWSE